MRKLHIELPFRVFNISVGEDIVEGRSTEYLEIFIPLDNN